MSGNLNSSSKIDGPKSHLVTLDLVFLVNDLVGQIIFQIPLCFKFLCISVK